MTFATMLTMASFAACGGVEVEPAPEPPPPLPAEAPADQPVDPPADSAAEPPTDPGDDAPLEAQLSVSPQRGETGASVTLEARGLIPRATITIGFGQAQSEYEILESLEADQDGSLRTTARVPDWAEADRDYVFVADGPRSLAVARFTVTGTEDPPESVEVTGMLTDEGVECPALRSDDGQLYTLAGDTGNFTVGDRVTVQGTIAEMSTCMQGTTIRVESIVAGGGAGYRLTGIDSR